MKRPIFLSLVLALGLAAVASAQTGRKYSNAPTDVDYRMTIVEPQPNATIVGKDINIVLGLPTVPPGNKPQSAAADLKLADTNTPIFQIWVDGNNMGNLPGGTNVFSARGLSYGPHKIVVIAKNTAGNLVDRQEVSVTNVETAGSVSVSHAAEAAPEPVSAPSTRVASAPAPAPPASVHTSLPHTGSAYPLAAAAGLLLLGAGIALRTKA